MKLPEGWNECLVGCEIARHDFSAIPRFSMVVYVNYENLMKWYVYRYAGSGGFDMVPHLISFGYCDSFNDGIEKCESEFREFVDGA